MPGISEILAQEDFGKIVSDLCVDTIGDRDPREYMEEYNGDRTRRPTSVGRRENKKIAVYSDTEVEIDENGKETPKQLEDKTVFVAKLVTNIPKKIVRTAAAFLFGGEMKITADNTDDNSLEEFNKVFVRKLKMKSILMKFARVVLSETKGAIIFYPVVKEKAIGEVDGVITTEKKAELKVKLLSTPKDESVTSEFYPHFDEDDDMDAFIHKYNIRIDGRVCESVKIYTADEIITAVNNSGLWEIQHAPNLFRKIPVVYADIDRPDWEDVARLIDAYEMRISRMADTNDYFGDPMLKTFGLSNLPSKDTVGKELNFSMEVDPDTGTAYHGDAEYLAWQQSIDSQKEELATERHEIFSGASCPDLSFDNLVTIGDLSGVAREFMTIDAKIKATEQMEIFGPVVQRCISIVTAGMAYISHIKYEKQLLDNFFEASFGSILPKNLKEELENLSLANGGRPFNATETITARSPYTTGNPQDETSKMQKEEQETAKNNSLLGATF